jgi:hypothetical protein
MEYQKRSKNGDAEEYFVAYSATKLLGWRCRLYEVDIDIDGEMEVLANAGDSTGDVIKPQIKTFDHSTKPLQSRNRASWQATSSNWQNRATRLGWRISG